MIAKAIYFGTLLLISFLSFHPLQAQTPFQKLTHKFEKGAVFHADFTQRTIDSYTGNKTKQSGEIWVGKKRYRVKSGEKIIAVDGKTSHVYDRKRNRVIISTYDPSEDDFAPSRFLSGVDSTFTITKQQKKGNNYIIKLQSHDPFVIFKKVKITLNKQYIPRELYVVDTADNKIITAFSGGSFIHRKADMFALSYPDNARVIDMRK
jgi:outer membrane lipoprotein-sorting protein